MRDRITANLPARSLDETASFYAALGFCARYKDPAWMIMSRGDLELEFFAHPELDPSSSWFSACVRVADLDGLHRAWTAAGLPTRGIPRITEPMEEPSGLRMFALVDPNGSLLRCLGPDEARRPAAGEAPAPRRGDARVAGMKKLHSTPPTPYPRPPTAEACKKVRWSRK